MSKLLYLARSLGGALHPERHKCPNCGSAQRELVATKYVITRLVRCLSCKLQYRTPTDSDGFNKFFYNYFYSEGTTTALPTASELEQLLRTRFAGTERDYTRYVALLKECGLSAGSTVFDFGCSWGYGSYQFSQAGFSVSSYEIGAKRRDYGIANLGVNHIADPYAIAQGHPLFQSFDCFFSAHVLEHVPSPSRIFELARTCLKPGGVFIAVTPNGSDAFRHYNPAAWNRMWGGVHPNYLDDVFYDHHFADWDRSYRSPGGGLPFENYELGFSAVNRIDSRAF